MPSRRRDSRGRRSRSSGGALDIQGTLGTLLRTTLHQVGVVREVVERQARNSLEHLDGVMLQRRRRERLAQLGELIYEMACDGELGTLGEHRDIRDLVQEIEHLEAQLYEDDMLGEDEEYWPDDRHRGGGDPRGSAKPGGAGAGAGSRAGAGAGAKAGNRAAGKRAGDEPYRVWRPVLPEDEEPSATGSAAAARKAGGDGDKPAKAGRDGDKPAKAGRDGDKPANPAGGQPATGTDSDAHSAHWLRGHEACEEAPSRRKRSRGQSDGGSGISFVSDAASDEDNDLHEYMHEDDVPRRD